jgi:hypothetical protein
MSYSLEPIRPAPGWVKLLEPWNTSGSVRVQSRYGRVIWFKSLETLDMEDGR